MDSTKGGHNFEFELKSIITATGNGKKSSFKRQYVYNVNNNASNSEELKAFFYRCWW